jgi:hypothetical protein
MTALGHHRRHTRDLKDELVAPMRVPRAGALVRIGCGHRGDRPLDCLEMSGIACRIYGARLLFAGAQFASVISPRDDFHVS